MARRLEKHRQRQEQLDLLGKDLARRARQSCELCREKGDLRAHETAVDQEPALETVVLLCSRCRDLAGGQSQDARTLRFLADAAWSDVDAVAQLARQLVESIDADWARDACELWSEHG